MIRLLMSLYVLSRWPSSTMASAFFRSSDSVLPHGITEVWKSFCLRLLKKVPRKLSAAL